MTETEYLLTKLGEECNEVAQRCAKAQCFGLREIQPGQPFDNVERLNHELLDLVVIADMLRKRGVDVLPIHVFTNALAGDRDKYVEQIETRRAKVEKFMQYSRECGTLK